MPHRVAEGPKSCKLRAVMFRTGHIVQLLRPFVVALYVLAMLLPAAVSAGVQLSPSPQHLLDRDIAASRCLDNQDLPASHHEGAECCVMCGAPQLPVLDMVSQAVAVAFPHANDAWVLVADQTRGLRIGLNQRPPVPRGPPA